MAQFQYLKVEQRESTALISVDRQDKLNALNADTVSELRSALETAAADDRVRCVIFTGAGEKAFVAGADIEQLSQMNPLGGVQVSRQGQDVFRYIETLGKPVIAAVNGFALGGGLELALACHIRLASDSAKFGLPEVKLGIIPGYGGTVRLPRLIGRGRALEMMLTGDMIDAQEAYRMGLVNRVLPQAELLEGAQQLARKMAANGPVALALAIEALDHGYHATTEDALRLESNLFGLLAATQDMREGMQAFLEKRRPNFQGS